MDLKPTKPLGGFTELTPPRQKCFDECARRMRAVLRTAGFARLDLPAIERAEVLTDQDNWDEIATQMYLFEKGGTKMGLRYDGTIGLARYVAGHMNDLVFPFRAYQFAKNYRGERPQKGRYREFWQMDLDILGTGGLSLNYDAEIVSVLSKAYDSIKEFVGPVSVRVGSRTFWNAMFEYLALAPEQSREVFILIDKKDKLGDAEFPAALRAALCAAEGEGNPGRGPAGPGFSGGGNFDKASEILSVFSSGYASFAEKSRALGDAVKELDALASQLSAMGVNNAAIDLSIMRGHAYYTGVVFEFFLDKFPELGAVGGGGRYENLLEKFSRTKIIGVGAAVGFSRMMVALLEDGRIDLTRFETGADVAVLVMGAGNIPYAMAVLTALRNAGIIAIPFLDADKKLKVQLEFADKINCKYSMIIGDDEVKNEEVALKDMVSGAQSQIPVSKVVDCMACAR